MEEVESKLNFIRKIEPGLPSVGKIYRGFLRIRKITVTSANSQWDKVRFNSILHSSVCVCASHTITRSTGHKSVLRNTCNWYPSLNFGKMISFQAYGEVTIRKPTKLFPLLSSNMLLRCHTKEMSTEHNILHMRVSEQCTGNGPLTQRSKRVPVFKIPLATPTTMHHAVHRK